MKFKFVFISVLALLVVNCSSKSKPEHYHSKSISGFELEFVDSIKINQKNEIIGIIEFMGSFGDNFYLSDWSNAKIHILDKNFNITKSIGREGRGPGEFRGYPILIHGTNETWIMDIDNVRIHKFDEKLDYKSSVNLPEEFSFLYYEPICFNNSLIFSGQYLAELNDKYYDDYTALLAFDMEMNFKCGVMDWDMVYRNEDTKGAARNGFITKFTSATENFFYAIQHSSPIIHKIGKNLNTTKTFGVIPKNYKTVVKNLDFSEVQKSRESVIAMGSQESHNRKICYDSTNNYLYIAFNNPSLDTYKKRDSDYTDKYLVVYNDQLDCIIDVLIDGFYLFSADGFVYVLKEQLDEKIIIHKYEVVYNGKG